jgi:hypothetical protein
VTDEYTEPVQVVALSLHEERLAAAVARAEEAERKLTEAEERWRRAYFVRESEAASLRARIEKAVEILSEPGMWSDFAARARKALTDG